MEAEIQPSLYSPGHVLGVGCQRLEKGQLFLIPPKLLSQLSRLCSPERQGSFKDGGLPGGSDLSSAPLPPRPLQCVNELNQWLSALRKVCINNTGLLGSYHPGVFRGDKWSCCHQRDKTGGMQAGNPQC